MRIDWNQKAAGIDIADIRDVLIRASSNDGGISLHSVASAQRKKRRPDSGTMGSSIRDGRDQEAALVLLQVLAASGLIGSSVYTTMPGMEIVYQITSAGLSLVNSSRMKRISRSKAMVAVEELRAAAAAVNADPTMMHDVVELAIYGSILTDAADLGDVDVAYGIQLRENLDFDAFDDAHPQPLSFPTLSNVYRWPAKVVERRLRVRRCISLSQIRNVRALGCPMRTLLPEQRDIAPSAEWSPIRAEVVLREDGGVTLAVLNDAIMKRDAQREQERREFQVACLAGNPPPGADPKRVSLALLTARL